MEQEHLSRAMREALAELRFASQTITADIGDAVLEAESERGFLQLALAALDDLRSECDEWHERLSAVALKATARTNKDRREARPAQGAI